MFHLEKFKFSKILTFFLLIFTFQVKVSCEEINPVINQTRMKDNLRWEFYLPKDSLAVLKKENILSINILKPEYLEKIALNLEKLQVNNEFFSNILVKKASTPTEVSSLEVSLLGNQVEIFSFYRDNENKQIIDFWINSEALPKNTEVKIEAPPVVIPTRKITSVKNEKVNFPKKFLKPKIPDENFRDFRYGASFVWNYPPLISKPEKLINLTSKTPDFFYPIKDLRIIDSEKLAHLQLSINLYKRSQFGLMNKSVDLYFKKYGDQADIDINEFLKANALLKLNKGDLNKESSKFALNLLNNIYKRTEDYSFKKGILKYLVSVALIQDDYIGTLREATKLFLIARKYSDVDVATNLSSIILYSLAKLSQLDKIEEILKHPDYVKFISSQEALAYQTFVLLTQENTQEVIKKFEKTKKSLVDPIHEGILFNVAESYFREGKYQNAIEMFEKFLKVYSFHKNADSARLRIALSNDLLSKDPESVMALYKDVIDKTSTFSINFEARIRYVGIRCLRKRALTEEDLEVKAYLKIKAEEEKELTEDLKKTLWMVRLRNFIVENNFTDALAYLMAIPMDSLRPYEIKAFEGDGREIVFGMIQNEAKNENYPNLLKIYEFYNERFEKKINREPLTRYLVGKALLNIGTYDAFDANYEEFKNSKEAPAREFPLWIARDDSASPDYLMLDLAINKNIKLNNLEASKKLLNELIEKFPAKNRGNYYKSIISFKEEKYNEAIETIEKFLSEEKDKTSYDSSETLNILSNYTDAIYKIGDLAKYRKVSNALLEDTKSDSKNPKYKVLKERILYLNIEILAGEQKDENALLLESGINNFINSFPETNYKDRVMFLLGQTFIQQNKLEEGEKIMKELTEGNSVPNYIKELARTELSFIKIKNKTI